MKLKDVGPTIGDKITSIELPINKPIPSRLASILKFCNCCKSMYKPLTVPTKYSYLILWDSLTLNSQWMISSSVHTKNKCQVREEISRGIICNKKKKKSQ